MYCTPQYFILDDQLPHQSIVVKQTQFGKMSSCKQSTKAPEVDSLTPDTGEASGHKSLLEHLQCTFYGQKNIQKSLTYIMCANLKRVHAK